MSSRRTPRQLLVAVLLGVLVGGGLMAVSPAGAEVSQAAASSWNKIWKKNLKPLADRRYYTKTKSRKKFATKAESSAATAAAAAASKAAADAAKAAATASAASKATDTKLGNYYTKADIDSKLGPFVNSVAATAGGDQDLALTSADNIVRSVSLMPPANGTVIVSSSGQLQGISVGISRCSISLTGELDTDAYQIVSGAAGQYHSIAGTRGFVVTKGSLLTVNLVCNEFTGDATLRDSALTAIFAPS